MIHSVAFALGYLLMILAGLVLGSLLIIGVTKLVNRAMWAVLDCYGGLKTLREFQRWYRARDLEARASRHA